MGTVLIAGGRGGIGRRLTETLLQHGWNVSVLTRTSSLSSVNHSLQYYYWNPQRGEFDPSALKDVYAIVQLAGANIAEGRWTTARKAQLYESRVASTDFLFGQVQKHKPPSLKCYIGISATGYYGTTTTENIFVESDPPGSDFLAQLCVDWERAHRRFSQLGIEVWIYRTGVVLDTASGFLTKILPFARWGLLAPPGRGRHWLPWIHYRDLVEIFRKSTEGLIPAAVYNAVAPEHVRHIDFYRTLVQIIHRPMLLQYTPPVLLRVLYGEMAYLLLEGSRVSCQKLIDAGYTFHYPEHRKALEDLLEQRQ